MMNVILEMEISMAITTMMVVLDLFFAGLFLPLFIFFLFCV
jgi:hypothetical protein